MFYAFSCCVKLKVDNSVLCVYCASIVRLLCVNSASIVRNILDIDGVLMGSDLLQFAPYVDF